MLKSKFVSHLSETEKNFKIKEMAFVLLLIKRRISFVGHPVCMIILSVISERQILSSSNIFSLRLLLKGIVIYLLGWLPQNGGDQQHFRFSKGVNKRFSNNKLLLKFLDSKYSFIELDFDTSTTQIT